MASGGGGNFMRQHTRLCAMGGTLHSTEIGSRGIADLLRQGLPVFVASDVKGRSPVRFLGQERVGSSGAPRIAQQTGSPVVVMTFERDGDDPRVRLHEPLDPAAFETPEALLDAMLARHESAVRAWPEAYDEPLKRWGTPAAPTT
jgi:lauroyl/myristoyl acyltransferase